MTSDQFWKLQSAVWRGLTDCAGLARLPGRWHFHTISEDPPQFSFRLEITPHHWIGTHFTLSANPTVGDVRLGCEHAISKLRYLLQRPTG